MNKLREIRENHGLRLIDVATQCGVGIATIWNIENGYEQRASKKTKQKIASGLKVEIRDIFPE